MRKRLAIIAVALVAAYLLKRFYSHATAAQLRFILAPTARLVSLASGVDFSFLPHGWVSNQARFVIAPVCAGVNFLIAAFVSLTIAFARTWRALLVCALAAFAATLCANTLRIAIAIALHVHHLGGEGLHRLEGIVVYLAMLLGLFAIGQRVAGGARFALPLACYFGITLVIPLLRGAWARPEFWQHAAVVVLLLTIAAAILRRRSVQ